MKVDRFKIAEYLYKCFEMRFSRDWVDLPADVQLEWLCHADDLINALDREELS
jgi:hypothetical protein